MRLMIVLLVLVGLVVVDQYKFGGYYGSELSRFITQAIKAVT